MPIHEYKCKNCKNEFEKLSKTKNENVSCPDCNSNDVEKLITNISDSKHGGCENCKSCSGCHH